VSEYKDFSKDFIQRTKCNLAMYDGKYEVTHLINSCLGLIIIPKEMLAEKLSNEPAYEDDLSYGISKEKNSIKDDYAPNGDKTYSLKNIIRHIRNGLSHGRIEQRVKNREIVGLRIYDKQNEKSSENFSIDFTIEQFKTFALRVADDFLNIKTE
jgi:hypothetical protein